MKVVLFCGGAGMRLRGYVDDVPKPMVQIGSRPILWHLMKYYAHFGHADFILCLGYKGCAIKDYFLNYDESVSNDFIWSQGGKQIQFVNRDIDDWTITFVETGVNATIGERLKLVILEARQQAVRLLAAGHPAPAQEQVGDAGHGRGHHAHAMGGARRHHQVRHRAEAVRIGEAGAAEFHDADGAGLHGGSGWLERKSPAGETAGLNLKGGNSGQAPRGAVVVVLPVMVCMNRPPPADDSRGVQGTWFMDGCMCNIFRDAPAKVNPRRLRPRL